MNSYFAGVDYSPSRGSLFIFCNRRDYRSVFTLRGSTLLDDFLCNFKVDFEIGRREATVCFRVSFSRTEADRIGIFHLKGETAA